jgi:hypothetical protein
MLYVFAALALVLIVSVAWWTKSSLEKDAKTYTVQAGDTELTIAEDHGVSVTELAAANEADVGKVPVETGKLLLIPSPSPTPITVWFTHLVGIMGVVLGVFMSLWLALAAGLLPKPIRKQVLGISMVVGLVSYASTFAVVSEDVVLTPTFLFIAIKDGFAWAAAFPMLARALGIRDEPQVAGAPPSNLPADSPDEAGAPTG